MSNLSLLQKLFKSYGIFIFLFAAAFLRCMSLPFVFHMDEWIFAERAQRMVMTNDFNPHWFGWPGSFVMYVLVGFYKLAIGLAWISGGFSQSLNLVQTELMGNSTFVYMSGRIFMVVFSLISIASVYFLAYRGWGVRVASLATLCLVVSPLHVNYSRILRPDNPSTALVLLSLGCIALYMNSPQKTFYRTASAICVGFAIATKYTMGLALLPLLWAVIQNEKGKEFLPQVVRILFYVSASFFIAAPYFFFDMSQALKDLFFEARVKHIGDDGTKAMPNLIWYLFGVMKEGVGGIFFYLFTLMGTIRIGVSSVKDKFIYVLFPVSMILFLSIQPFQWERAFIPILPFAAISFGVGFSYVIEVLERRWGGGVKILMVVALCVAAFFPIEKNMGHAEFLKRPTAEQKVLEWIENNLSEDDIFVYEYGTLEVQRPLPKDKRYFNLKNQAIISHPISFYREKGVSIFILNKDRLDALFARFKEDKKNFSHITLRYEEIKRHADLVLEVLNQEYPGFTTEIYRLKK